MELLRALIPQLQQGEMLAERHRDHVLGGSWKHHRECHITPDWLLIYRLGEEELILDRTGSHSDLFDK